MRETYTLGVNNTVRSVPLTTITDTLPSHSLFLSHPSRSFLSRESSFETTPTIRSTIGQQDASKCFTTGSPSHDSSVQLFFS